MVKSAFESGRAHASASADEIKSATEETEGPCSQITSTGVQAIVAHKRAAGFLSVIFFVSGASALILENLWFRRSGLVLGNSVWASSLVLASFMGGLALGNGLIARYGQAARRWIRWYALLEAIIAITGAAAIFLLPLITPGLLALFRSAQDQPVLLNFMRLCAAFALMMIPTTAMGASLPLLVKALCRWEPNFGAVLGKLYGWNTLGAVVGVLAAEVVLIASLGIPGTALFAAGLNLAAAVGALWLSRVYEPDGDTGDIDGIRDIGAGKDAARAASAVPPLPPTGVRLLVAAGLAGASLLALEVVWFRFLSLFVLSTSLALTLMLAVVLAGIGGGGLIAARWLRSPSAPHHSAMVALAAGVVAVSTYAMFSPGQEIASENWTVALSSAVRLMLPVSMLSGALFALLGAAIKQAVTSEVRAVGWLALANTIGAMIGAVLSGFVLLPLVGVEKALLALAAFYGLVAVCIPRPLRTDTATWPRWVRVARYSVVAAFFLSLALFPHGRMRDHYLALPAVLQGQSNASPVTFQSGEDGVLYVRTDWAGKPLSHRLVTDGHSTSTSHVSARRYLKLFAYWPLSVHPAPKSALLLGYGIGQTAKALADAPELATIDIVDTSREVLDMGRIAFSPLEPYPLDDPRVRTRVEDSRFFLQTTDQRFDIITGEPPPPQAAGVVNRYTQEYFSLVYDRLAEGGIATHWLPVEHLWVSDTKAIIQAFCAVFTDCSLWNGFGFEWMLVGTRGAKGATAERMTHLWQNPASAKELAGLGFEHPEQLGALFIGDAEDLRAWTAGALPLTDDFPQRLVNRFTAGAADERYRAYLEMMSWERARERFRKSALIARLWPADLVESTLPRFRAQAIINHISLMAGAWQPLSPAGSLRELHHLLTRTDLRTPILWIMGFTTAHERIMDELGGSIEHNYTFYYPQAARALANRDYTAASDYLVRAQEHFPEDKGLEYMSLYALHLAGRTDKAHELARKLKARAEKDTADIAFWHFIGSTFTGS